MWSYRPSELDKTLKSCPYFMSHNQNIFDQTSLFCFQNQEAFEGLWGFRDMWWLIVTITGRILKTGLFQKAETRLDGFPEGCSFPERHHVVRSNSLNIPMGANFTIETNKKIHFLVIYFLVPILRSNPTQEKKHLLFQEHSKYLKERLVFAYLLYPKPKHLSYSNCFLVPRPVIQDDFLPSCMLMDQASF